VQSTLNPRVLYSWASRKEDISWWYKYFINPIKPLARISQRLHSTPRRHCHYSVSKLHTADRCPLQASIFSRSCAIFGAGCFKHGQRKIGIFCLRCLRQPAQKITLYICPWFRINYISNKVYLYLSLVKYISLEDVLLISQTCILGPDLRGLTIEQGFCEEWSGGGGDIGINFGSLAA
jgi:hypothetical protein